MIPFLGPPLALKGSGRYVSGLASLLGPAAALPLWSGLRPPFHIARPIGPKALGGKAAH